MSNQVRQTRQKKCHWIELIPRKVDSQWKQWKLFPVPVSVSIHNTDFKAKVKPAQLVQNLYSTTVTSHLQLTERKVRNNTC